LQRLERHSAGAFLLSGAALQPENLIDELISHTLQMSVSAAKAIPAHKVSVEARFIEYCARKPCPGFGKSLGCPPHARHPDQFKALLIRFHTALAFKFDVPTHILQSEARLEIFKKLHLAAAGLEQKALSLGFVKAHGLAAGSCWQIFCADRGDCPALEDPGKCRFPQKARPSISSQGVDVYKLCADLAWPIKRITKETDPAEVPMGLLAGLVLLG
jgi:predicted metal-binding protein